MQATGARAPSWLAYLAFLLFSRRSSCIWPREFVFDLSFLHSPLSSILSAHIARKWFRSFLILFTPSDLELSSSSRLFYGIFYLFILFWPCSIPAHFIIRVIIPPHFPLCTRALIHLYTSTRCCYFQHLSVVTISVTLSFRDNIFPWQYLFLFDAGPFSFCVLLWPQLLQSRQWRNVYDVGDALWGTFARPLCSLWLCLEAAGASFSTRVVRLLLFFLNSRIFFILFLTLELFAVYY